MLRNLVNKIIEEEGRIENGENVRINFRNE